MVHSVQRDDAEPHELHSHKLDLRYSERNLWIGRSIGLYFLGVLPFTAFNWGIMLSMAYTQAGALYSLCTIHYLLASIDAIVGLQIGLILFSYAIDKIFDPRLRAEA